MCELCTYTFSIIICIIQYILEINTCFRMEFGIFFVFCRHPTVLMDTFRSYSYNSVISSSIWNLSKNNAITNRFIDLKILNIRSHDFFFRCLIPNWIMYPTKIEIFWVYESHSEHVFAMNSTPTVRYEKYFLMAMLILKRVG